MHPLLPPNTRIGGYREYSRRELGFLLFYAEKSQGIYRGAFKSPSSLTRRHEMGDDNVELLEQTVKHNAEDIKEVRLDLKELTKEFDQFKMKHTVVESNVNQIFTMLSKVEEKMGALEGKWDQAKDDQNKELKGFILKIAAIIVGAVFLTVLGLK